MNFTTIKSVAKDAQFNVFNIFWSARNFCNKLFNSVEAREKVRLICKRRYVFNNITIEMKQNLVHSVKLR